MKTRSRVFVAIHDGNKFKRASSTAAFSHVVLRVHNIEKDRAHAQWDAARRFKEDLEDSQNIVEHDVHLRQRDGESTEDFEERKAERKAKERAWQADPKNTEAVRVAEGLAAFDKELEFASRSSDGVSYYKVAGWRSRRELAERLAARQRKVWYLRFDQVLVVPARVQRGGPQRISLKIASRTESQTVYTGKNPHRKAILTRIGARRWAYRLGWKSDIELKAGGERESKWLALIQIGSFLNG